MANASIQTIELPKKARALDTSGNNNHGQIYSGRGLEFDGVSDHCTFTTSETFEEFTVVAWVYVNAISDRQNIWDGSDAGSYISIDDAATGQYDLQWYIGSEGSPSGWQQGGIALNINTWYRVVFIFKKNGSAGDYKAYVNGVEDTTGSFPVEAGGNFTSGTFNGFGSVSSGNSRFLDGMMSDMQIWDTSWSTDDVTYDYLNPESLALNRGGTSLTNSNLKLWYPMQDGHRGQQSYILDGANTGLNDELATWAGEDVDVGAYVGIEANTTAALVVGTTYKVTFTVSNYTSGSFKFRQPSGGVDLGPTGDANGDYVQYGTATNATELDCDAFNLGFEGTISNISAKAVNDKNHATTVFHGDEIWDGVQGDDANWNVFGNNTKAEDAGAVKITYVDNASGGYIFLSDAKDLNADLVVGRTYIISFSTKVNQGSIIWRCLTSGGGTNALATAINSTSFETRTMTVVADHATNLYIHSNAMTTGDIVWIKDISVKEVGIASGWTDADQQLHIPQTALQSYNQLAWFDGNDDVVTCDNGFTPGDNTTVAFWVFLNGPDGESKGLFNCFSYQSDNFRITVDSSNRLLTQIQSSGVNTTYTDSRTQMTKDKWIHVCATIPKATSSTGTMYINGEGQDYTTTTTMVTASRNINFLHGGGLTQDYVPGSITEVSIYSDILTQAEVNDLYNDGKAKSALEADGSGGLSAYWRNNGLATWIDLTGDGNDGTVTCDETLLLPAGVDASRDNQGFLMNRQKDTSSLNLTSKGDEYVVVPDASTIQLASTAASWCMWVKLDSLSDGDQKLLSKAPSAGSPSSVYQIRTSDDDLLFQIYSGGWYSDTRSTFFTSTDWTHVVVTIDDSNNVNFYKNGDVFGSEANVGAVVPANTGNLNIGTRVQSAGVYDEFLKGKIDGILLYNKELSSIEVLRNYNAGKVSHRN